MEATVKIRTNFNLVKMFIAGLNSEGLYRVSGFSDLIEDVKMAFDRGTVFPACWNLVLMYKIYTVFLQSLCLTLHCTGGLKESDGCAGRRGDAPSEKHISFTLAFITKIYFSPSISICAPVTMCAGKDKALWTTALVCKSNCARRGGGGIEGKWWSALRELCNLNPSFWMKAPK